MRFLLPFLLAGCTNISPLHNPACLIFCSNNGGDTITTQKEIHHEKAVPARPDPVRQ